MELLLVLLMIEASILTHSIRRYRFLPYPHGIMLYIIGGQTSLYLVAKRFIEYEFIKLYTSYDFVVNYNTINIYLFIYFIALAAMQVPKGNERINLGDSLFGSLEKISKSNISTSGIAIFTMALYAHFAIIAFSINWSLVWHNDTYLLMGDYRILNNINIVSTFALSIDKLIGLAGVCVAGFCYSNKNYREFIALLPITIFHFAYELGSHSRASFLYVAVFAVLIYAIRRKPFIPLLLSVASAFVLIYCLGGRNLQNHGLSSISMFTSILMNNIERQSSDTFLNLFEGIFSSSEIFTYSHSFSTSYKILSFSPLPSFVDNFDAIINENIIRLHLFVPPSAILEAHAFGAPYSILLFVIQMIAGRMSIKLLSKRGGFVAVLLNILMLFAAYTQFTYPVRNVVRIFFIIMIFAFILERFEVMRAAKLRLPLDRQQKKASLMAESPIPSPVLRRRHGEAAGTASTMQPLPPAVARRRGGLQAARQLADHLPEQPA